MAGPPAPPADRPGLRRAARLAAGVAAAAAPALMWAEFLGAGLATPGFNLLTRAASDLGARGAPAADLFRPGFFLLPGALTAITGAGLAVLPGSRWWRAGALLVVLEGALLVMAGVFPEDPASAAATARHQLFASACFGAAALAPPLLLAGAPSAPRPLRRTWLVTAGLLLLIEAAGIAAGRLGQYPPGLFQRPFGVTLTAWYLATAGWLLAYPAAPAEGPARRGPDATAPAARPGRKVGT